MDQYKYIVSTPLNLGKGKAGWVILEICQKRGGGGGGGGLEKYFRGGCDIFRKEVAAFP